MISLIGSIWATASPEMESSIATVIQATLRAVLPVHGVTGLFLTRQIVSFTLIIICRSLRFESEHWIGLSFHSFEWQPPQTCHNQSGRNYKPLSRQSYR